MFAAGLAWRVTAIVRARKKGRLVSREPKSDRLGYFGGRLLGARDGRPLLVQVMQGAVANAVAQDDVGPANQPGESATATAILGHRLASNHLAIAKLQDVELRPLAEGTEHCRMRTSSNGNLHEVRL